MDEFLDEIFGSMPEPPMAAEVEKPGLVEPEATARKQPAKMTPLVSSASAKIADSVLAKPPRAAPAKTKVAEPATAKTKVAEPATKEVEQKQSAIRDAKVLPVQVPLVSPANITIPESQKKKAPSVTPAKTKVAEPIPKVQLAEPEAKRIDARFAVLRLGEVSIVLVESTELKDVVVSPAEAKKILQTDEYVIGKRQVKLTRRISTSVDGRIFTFVCFDQWGSATADMGCVTLPVFGLEVERFRNCGPSALRYVISTAGPPFGRQVEILSVSSKQLLSAGIGKS